MSTNYLVVKPIMFLLLCLLTLASNAQTVPSSCTAPDSVVKMYKDDADRLALRKIYTQHLSYQDSVTIPQVHIDTGLRALLAVYNAALPASDTVTNLFHIHTGWSPNLRYFDVSADSGLSWMHQFKTVQFPTGYAAVDSLITNYHLHAGIYSFNGNLQPYHTVSLWSDSNWNLVPLAAKFAVLPGVYDTTTSPVTTRGADIGDAIYPDHVELTYMREWGDCPSGCMFHRYWKFNVYYNCDVEFAGSYGDPVVPQAITNLALENFSVYPNPFTDIIYISGTSTSLNFTIADVTGRVLITGETDENKIALPNSLAPGMYLLNLKAAGQTATLKIWKE